MTKDPPYALTLLQKHVSFDTERCKGQHIEDILEKRKDVDGENVIDVFIKCQWSKDPIELLSTFCMDQCFLFSAIDEQENIFINNDFQGIRDDLMNGREYFTKVQPNVLEAQLEELKDRNRLEELRHKDNTLKELRELWEEIQLDTKLSKLNEKEPEPTRYTREQLDVCEKIVRERQEIIIKNGEYFNPMFEFCTCLRELYGY